MCQHARDPGEVWYREQGKNQFGIGQIDFFPIFAFYNHAFGLLIDIVKLPGYDPGLRNNSTDRIDHISWLHGPANYLR